MKYQIIGATFLLAGFAARAESFPVSLTIGAAQPNGPLKPTWYLFDTDGSKHACMKLGNELLGEPRKDEVDFCSHDFRLPSPVVFSSISISIVIY